MEYIVLDEDNFKIFVLYIDDSYHGRHALYHGSVKMNLNKDLLMDTLSKVEIIGEV